MTDEKKLQQAVAREERRIRARAEKKERPVGAHGAMGWWLFRKQQAVAPAFADGYYWAFDGVDESCTIAAGVMGTAETAWSVAIRCRPTTPLTNRQLVQFNTVPTAQTGFIRLDTTEGISRVNLNGVNQSLTGWWVSGAWQVLLLQVSSGAIHGYSARTGDAGLVLRDTVAHAGASAINISGITVLAGGFPQVDVSEMALYSGTLNAGDRTAICDGTDWQDPTADAGLAAKLRGWWRFGDIEGDTPTSVLTDASGNGNDGTPSNMEAGDQQEADW